MNRNVPAPIFNEFDIKTASNLVSGPVTQELVDKMNRLAQSEELSQIYKENLITYTSVLQKGAFTPDQYVSAVQYVSYRLMGNDVRPSWEKTFPDRYQKLLAKGASSKAIHSHASAYNKTKLVMGITEQSLIPSYIVNNGYFQEALDTAMEIVRDTDASDKNRIDALGKVLDHTAMPESLMGSKEEISDKGLDIIAQLAKATADLAESKRASIASGDTTAKDAARRPIYTINENGDRIDD